MYRMEFLSYAGHWSRYMEDLKSSSLDHLVTDIFECYAHQRPRIKRRIIDLNTGEIVYT